MDLSVIVPCHNLENYITPLLMSLAAQDRTGIEVEYVFICDNCTDNTEKVIEDFWNDFDPDFNIYIIEASVSSCGLARNIGLECSEGEYIWFMDGDDWLLTTKAFQKVLSAIKSQEADLLKFRFLSEKFKLNYFGMVWQYIFKRDIIGDLKFDSQSPGEDDRFTQKIFSKTKDEIFELQEPLYYYNYMREGSNMWKVLNQKI